KFVLLVAALGRLDCYRRQSHEGISSNATDDIPSNIPPEGGDTVEQRRITTDAIADKYQGKQPLYGQIWTAMARDLERVKGIEPSS
ncbi:MAG: hypothetical protein ACRC1J_10260, partial [Sandaracinobacteroides sp.]